MNKSSKLQSQSSQLIFNALITVGAKVKIISSRFNLMKVDFLDKSFFLKSTSFSVNSQPSCIIANNKFLTKKILRLANILTPKSYLAKTAKEVKRIILEKEMFPCVVKPTTGSHGDGVYANIESIEELEQILKYTFPNKGKREVLIEEYVNGIDYRVLVVGDKASAIMERIPAHVIGDGVNTLRQLITKFNKNPLVGKKHEKPMCKIRLNGEIKRMLNKKGINLAYVAEKNKKIFLRQNANISTGGIGRDATDTAPPLVSAIAIQATKAIGMQIAGADVLYDPLSKKAYILELNNTPGIDIHHFPVIGKSQNVALDIVEYICKNNAYQIN